MASVRTSATPPSSLIQNAARPLALRQRALLSVGLTVTLAVAAIAMTWPYVRHLSDATIVGFDPFLQIWLSEWIRHALTTDPRALYDANIFYPFAQTLAYTDANIPGALLAAPISVATGDPVLTNSLLTLASFVVAAAGVYAVIVYLTGNRGAGLAAGLAYAFLPYRMIHLWHLNWLEGAWLPWLVLALLWLLARPTMRRGAIVGLLAAILILTSFYFSVQILLICATLVIAASIAHRRWPSPGLIAAGVMALLVTVAIAAPLDIPYLQVRDEQGLERTVVDAEQYKALPESYLRLAPWDQPSPLQVLLGLRAGPNESLTEVGQAQHADGHRHPEIVIEDALFPGLFAVVFAIVALAGWRRQRWLVAALTTIAVISALLSLGPTLGPRHGDGPPLPYGFLFEHAPFFRAMRVPARLGGLTDLAIVLLAGLGMAVAWERLRNSAKTAALLRDAFAGPIVTALLALAVLAELWTGGVPIEAVDRSPDAAAASEWLAMQPNGPIMEFPAESVFADPAGTSVRRHYGEEMFWSIRHWMPLVNGNSGFIPRAYSDFIERFVGQVRRPDGSLTDRISHLEPDAARLLQQIGVRYLVFHRSQYRPQDWTAVAAQLETMAASGLVEAAGDHGEATIYILEPAAPPIEAPTVALYAPTLGTPDSRWAPWLAVAGASGTPSVLSLTRPPMLETTWFSEDGRWLWQGTQRMPLPVVMDDPWLLCGASECLTARPIDDLRRLPPPDPDAAWRPTEPGHYVVRYRLSGDHPLDCRVDLDLVATASDVQERSRDEPYRWAECIPDHPNPINNPGAAPFALGPPSVTLVGDEAAVDIALTPRQDEEVRGWFTLAPPGSQAPWTEAVYQSPLQQKLLPAAESTAFEWNTTVDAPPGVYGLTVWFHRNGPAGWEHAAGGDLHLAPIVVDADHSMRWAGPVRVQVAAPPGPLSPGLSTRIRLGVGGTSAQIACDTAWRLASGTLVVASGNSGPCDEAGLTLPANVAPGHYRLEVDAYARRSDGLRLSDGVSFPVTVVDHLPGGYPR
jgi:hypothetical protein